MATVDEIIVEIKGELGDINKKLNALERNVKRTTDKSSRAFQALSRVAVAALGVIGGQQMLRATGSIISLGASAEELENKFNVVFGQQAPIIRQELASFATVVGRSQNNLMAMAASVQDLFVPLGFTREKASELSLQLVKLAVDTGSFNDMLDTEVMQRFAGALIGNHENVQRFGVVINQAALQQELFRMGINQNVNAVDNQAKVTARLNLIIAGLKDVEGDAIETQDSFTNSSQNLTSAIRDLNTAIGRELLPLFAPVNSGLSDFVRAISEGLQRRGIIGPQSVAMEISIINAEIVKLNKKLVSAEANLQVFEAAAEGGANFSKELKKARNDVDEYETKLLLLKERLEELIPQTKAFQNAVGKTTKETKNSTERTQEQKDALDEVEKAIANVQEQTRFYKEGIMLQDDALTQANLTMLSYSDLKKQLREDDVGNLEVLRTLIVELNRQKEAYSESMTEMEKVAEAQKKLEELNKVFITSIEGLGSTLENSFVDALSGTKSALDSFKDFSKQLVEEILRTYLRLSIINPIINSAFEGVAGFTPRNTASGGQVLSNFAKIGRRILGGGAAGGGTIQGRQQIMVGERGPEMFIPNTGGRIVPNGALGGSLRGGSPTIVNQSLNFATGIQNTVRAEVMNMMPLIQNATLQAVVDQKRRGGAFAQGMS